MTAAVSSASAVTLSQVHRTYGSGEGAVHALRGVSFAFATGRFYAILGPSGSGKSTLLHLCAGLDVASEGHVAVLGHDTRAMDDNALARLRRRSVGFVFQFFNLVPTLSVEENALLPVLLDRRIEAKDRTRLDELLRRMELLHRRHKLPEQLSGGERQRAAIVRAMLPSPPLLLADEPTGSLDSVTGSLITHLLREQVERHGVCLIVVTHDPKVADLADEVLRLRDGEIVGHELVAAAGRR